MIEPQLGDLAFAQTVNGKQHEDRTIAQVLWAIRIQRGKQTPDLCPVRTSR
jgi:hypothetical protein